MKTLLLLTCALFVSAISASAQTTLLDDQFNASASYNLIGNAPDTVDPVVGGVAQKWVLDTSGISSNASTATAGGGSLTLSENNTGGSSTNPLIEFSSSGLTAANTLYTLSLDVGAITDGNGAQFNLGITPATGGTSANRTSSYFVQTSQGGAAAAYALFSNKGTLSGGTGTGKTGSTGANDLTLTFNTQTDIFSYYANGNLITTVHDTSGDEANLDYVMLDYFDPNTGGGSLTVSDLTLTETSLVPEPSTVALFLASGLAVCIYGWRRRSVAV